MTQQLKPYEELASALQLDRISGLATHLPFSSDLIAFFAPSNLRSISSLWIGLTVAWSFLLFPVIFFFDESLAFLAFPLFCLGPFVIGLVLVVAKVGLMRTLLSPPELLISDVQLRRDDTLDIHFTQTVKRKTTFRSVAITLLLRETATYQQGTSTVTVTHDNVFDEQVDFQLVVNRNEVIDRRLTFKIPSDAMHTFEAYRNKLDWYIKVQMDIPRFPNFVREYRLQLLPEVRHES